MNILDRIYKSLEAIFGVKTLNFFNADPETGSTFRPWVRDGKIKKFISWIRYKHPDPQHWIGRWGTKISKEDHALMMSLELASPLCPGPPPPYN
jgi:hypothetical protein